MFEVTFSEGFLEVWQHVPSLFGFLLAIVCAMGPPLLLVFVGSVLVDRWKRRNHVPREPSSRRRNAAMAARRRGVGGFNTKMESPARLEST